ncbi:MAG: hypothetical protein LAT68_16765 [Cyclobacteriaceae bacterium]|nr:hypothetical protein [Cyclobacteriaceae bacterium]
MKKFKKMMVGFSFLLGFGLFAMPSSSIDAACVGNHGSCIDVWWCNNCNGQEGFQLEVIILEGFENHL